MARQVTTDDTYMTLSSNFTPVVDFTRVTISMWIQCPTQLTNVPPGNSSSFMEFLNAGPNVVYQVYEVYLPGLLTGWVHRANPYGYYVKNTPLVPANTIWHHFLMTYDSDLGMVASANPYVDGELITPFLPVTNCPPPIKDPSIINSVRIGGHDNSSLAEVGIWNRILTAGERSRLYNDRYTPELIPDGLISAWRLLGNETPEPNSVSDQPGLAQPANPADAWTKSQHPAGIITALPAVTTAAYGGANIPFSPDSTTADNPLKYRSTTIQLENYDPNATYTQWRFQVIDEDASLHIVNRGYPRIITTPDDVGSIPELIEGGLSSMSIQIPNGKTLKVSARQPDSSMPDFQDWTDPVEIESQFHVSSRDRALIRSGLPLLDHTAERISTGVRMTTSLR